MSVISDKKAWLAFRKQVKAMPKDYVIVFDAIQNYAFKVAPYVPHDTGAVLTQLLELFPPVPRKAKMCWQCAEMMSASLPMT